MRSGRWAEVYPCLLTRLCLPCLTGNYLGMCKDFSKKANSWYKQALLQPHGTNKGRLVLTTSYLSLRMMFGSTVVLHIEQAMVSLEFPWRTQSIVPALAKIVASSRTSARSVHEGVSHNHVRTLFAVRRSGETSVCIHMTASQASAFARHVGISAAVLAINRPSSDACVGRLMSCAHT